MATTSCVRATHESKPLPPLEREVVARSELGEPAVSFRYERAGDMLHGHLAWADSCRRVVLVRERARPDNSARAQQAAGIVATFGGLALGGIGAELMQNPGTSPSPFCDAFPSDDGTPCEETRNDSTAALGGLLVATGIALAVTGVVTIAVKPAAESAPTPAGAANEARILATGVRCGEGAPSGIGVALYRGDERIAVSVSSEGGDVGFVLPAWLAGPVSVRVDSVPTRYDLVAPGQTLALTDLTPEDRNDSP